MAIWGSDPGVPNNTKNMLGMPLSAEGETETQSVSKLCSYMMDLQFSEARKWSTELLAKIV